MESLNSPEPKRITHVPLEEQREVILQKMALAGIEVKESNKDTFPKDVTEEGLTGLSDIGEKCLSELVVATRRFWSGLIIKDHYEKDEAARQRFQESMSGFPLYKEFDARNKLRTNVQDNLYTGFRLLVRELDKAQIETPQADKIRNIYAGMFPIGYVGYRSEEGLEAAANVLKTFPSMPPIDSDPSRLDSQGKAMLRKPSYREYYLELTEEQRFGIIDNFDKAAHDFLELVTISDGIEK